LRSSVSACAGSRDGVTNPRRDMSSASTSTERSSTLRVPLAALYARLIPL
jgi:hypothetical protein